MYNKFSPAVSSQKSLNNSQNYIPLLSSKNFFRCVKILIILWIIIYIIIATNYSKDIESKIEEENRIMDKFQDKLLTLMQHGIKVKNPVIDKFNLPENYTFDPNNPLNLDDGLTDEAKRFIKELNLTNPGENAAPIKIPLKVSNEVKRLIKHGFDTFGYNHFISTLVSLNRALPDVRPDECKQKVYRNDKFSKISIVIPFYNDDWNLLMRTVHSVIRMTPLEYILEILLVDDCSTMEHLKEPLDKYTATLPVNIRIIRSHTRLGIVSNRVLGARNARAPIIVYIDSHVELHLGWIDPILDRFVDNMDLIVVPNISLINPREMSIDYKYNVGKMLAIDWQLQSKLVDIKWFEGTNATPTWDPKIAPIGIFAVLAIGRKFYERIGYLDIDMDVWGGEDYELVFRTWLCGGRVEFVPCSNIAHMFRKHVYSINLKGKGGYKWNMARIVETWMDDYKKYFYKVLNGSRVEYGDLTERIELKKKLNCKPFQWYIDNIYPKLNDIPKKA